jgi:endoglucanase
VTATPQAPNMTLSANPTSVTLPRGTSQTVAVTIARTGGFTSSVTCSASGQPSGVTAGFNPASTIGTSTTLTLTASATATLGSSTVTVSCTGGGLTRTVTIALTITAATTPELTLSANPTSVTANRGASGSSTLTLTRTNFTSSVTLTAAGLPTGVAAAFNPPSTTGTSSIVTFASSATATLGTAAVTVTATGGGLTRTATISLTVGPASTGGNGGVTATPVASTSPWFNEESVRLANAAPLTSLSLTIVVQRTTGISASGQYNTVGGQIAQSNSSTVTAATYQYTLAAGQTLGIGTNWTFAAQTSGSGTAHPTAGDTYTLTYTTGGTTFTQMGHF